MRVIICSEYNATMKMLETAIEASGYKVKEVVLRGGRGADRLGEKWAIANGVPMKMFWAQWKYLKAPGAVIKENDFGPYNSRAGFDRDAKMARYANALIVVGDVESFETSSMLKIANKEGLLYYIYSTGPHQDSGWIPNDDSPF